MAAHLPIHVSGNADPAHDLDVVVFSGHKVYAPGSPGVVVTRKELFAGFEPQEVGGGMVDDVHLNRYLMLDRFPDREEAGTPNISGAIGLAASLYALSRIGMETIAREEKCEHHRVRGRGIGRDRTKSSSTAKRTARRASAPGPCPSTSAR